MQQIPDTAATRECALDTTISPAIRPTLDQLRGEGILELERGAYRASEVALYSSYQLPLPAARPGTAKPVRQITAIG